MNHAEYRAVIESRLITPLIGAWINLAGMLLSDLLMISVQRPEQSLNERVNLIQCTAVQKAKYTDVPTQLQRGKIEINEGLSFVQPQCMYKARLHPV